jgi:hypothetical protein
LAGSAPEMELWPTSRVLRRRRRPTVSGMPPWSALEDRLSTRRKVRFPMAGESVPDRLLDARLSATTRPGLRRRLLHTTPYHLQATEAAAAVPRGEGAWAQPRPEG